MNRKAAWEKLVDDVNISVYRGEILGIAGLMGARRTEFALSLFGMLKADEKKVNCGLMDRESKSDLEQKLSEWGIGYVCQKTKAIRPNIIATLNAICRQSLKRLTLMNRYQNLEITQAQQYVKDLNIKGARC